MEPLTIKENKINHIQMTIETYWKKAVSFEEYLAGIQKKTEYSDKEINDKEIVNKYKLSLKRITHVINNYSPDIQQQKIFEEKKFNGKILIIAEGWCGDCSQSVPVITTFFKQNSVKILQRDENPGLTKMFLTNGSESIPIVIFLKNDNSIITHWGSRTQFGKELLTKYKKDPENYPKETFLSDLHDYYTNNNGVDIINEILPLL